MVEALLRVVLEVADRMDFDKGRLSVKDAPDKPAEEDSNDAESMGSIRWWRLGGMGVYLRCCCSNGAYSALDGSAYTLLGATLTQVFFSVRLLQEQPSQMALTLVCFASNLVSQVGCQWLN